MNTPHPEFETLAELAEHAEPAGGIPNDDARSHVASCPQCRAEIAALRDVQRTLASLPDIPMPDDVAARLEHALRAETDSRTGPAVGGADVTVLPERSRSSSRTTGRRLPHLSAAAAVTLLVVIALGAGITALVNGGSGESKSSGANTAGLATNKTTVLASGHDYSKATIRTQVAKLMLTGVPDASSRYSGLQDLADAARPEVSAAPSAPAAAVPTTTGSYGTSSEAGNQQPAPTAPGGPLASSEALKACIVALVDQPVTPILVDYAVFEGKPATIIVLPDPDVPNVLDLYVEDYSASCVAKGEVTYFGTLPATSP